MGSKINTFIGAASVAIATIMIISMVGTTTERVIIKPDRSNLMPIYFMITFLFVVVSILVYCWVRTW